jgi:ATP-dependent helicase HrpB
MNSLYPLPIDALKDQLLDQFSKVANIVLKASPGSGKTTRLPLYLLPHVKKKIYILEPRRLAAKLAAIQVARELGEKIGESVGYVFRYESVYSEKTRIFFLTEGTFLKILSQNKNLSDVDLVILDEFHERHLSTDASLSFLTKLQKENRPDLKLMVMSATIETTPLENYLQQTGLTALLELNSSRYELEQNFLPNVTSVIQAPLAKKVLNCFQDIMEKNIEGDILIFLPGMKEIRDCFSLLEGQCAHYEMNCLILHGDLDSKEQDLVLVPHKKRKCILSTNIAESSVTIPGIRIVIDSGLQRESTYNFFSGLPELKITKISKAQAVQRAGRANREGKGFCFRLYAELDYEQRPYFHRPEIEKSDLSELYLLCLSLFQFSLEKLDWLETPPKTALTNAQDLLQALNAVSPDGKLSEIGNKLLQYPLHPRLARILVEAQKTNPEMYKLVLTSLADFLEEKNRDRFFKMLSYKDFSLSSPNDVSLEELFLKGFPDRVAKTRGEKYHDVILMNGETLKISPTISQDFDPRHELWIVMDLNNKGEVTKCLPIEEDWLFELDPFPLKDENKFIWEEKKNSVVQINRTMIGKIVLSEEKIIPEKSHPEIRKILSDVARNYIQSLHETQEYERLLTLNRLLDNKDIAHLEDLALQNFFQDHISFGDPEKSELSFSFYLSLKEQIDPENVYHLENDFPLFIQLTDKRKIPINYDRTKDPWIESYIQDFYGLTKTPQLAKGKLPLTLQLLGPHKRAIQVTQDLASFWNKTYPGMIKELSREYPRHYWPENPSTAKPFLLKRQVL